MASMDAAKRAVAWAKDDPFGVEFAEIALAPEHLTAEGVAIGTGPIPYRLDYTLETASGFVTSRLRVNSRGEGWRRTLDLSRDAAAPGASQRARKAMLISHRPVATRQRSLARSTATSACRR